MSEPLDLDAIRKRADAEPTDLNNTFAEKIRTRLAEAWPDLDASDPVFFDQIAHETAVAAKAEADRRIVELTRVGRQLLDQRGEALAAVERLTAERDAMRPVVEAAVVWRRDLMVGPPAHYAEERALAAAVDAYTAAQTPGVDTGTSEARTAAHGDAGPADGVVAAESDPLAEAIAAYFRGFVHEEGATYRDGDFAEGLIESLTGAGWNLDAIGHPRTGTPAVGPCMNRLASNFGPALVCDLPHGHAGGHRDGHTSWALIEKTWALPDEPGPEVTAVRAKAGRIYRRVYDGWRGDGLAQLVDWHELLRYAPLTDATGETP